MTALILLPENVPVPTQSFFFEAPADPNWSYSDGNRTVTKTSNGVWNTSLLDPTFTKASGKWYLEFQNTLVTTPFGNITGHTIVDQTVNWIGSGAGSWGFLSSTGVCPSVTGRVSVQGIPSNYGQPFCAIPPTKTVMIAADLDAGQVWYGVDGIWSQFPAASDPSTGTNPAYTDTIAPNARFGVSCYNATESWTIPTTLSYPVPTGFSVLV